MRVAVISDIHGNLAALERVLQDVDRRRPDAVWCLGDTVGYGPRPNECCALVRERADVCLIGNHDLLVLGRDVIASDFNVEGAAAAAWTRSVLSDDARAFLEGLSPEARQDGVALYHASARDPVWEYVLSRDVARATIELAGTALVVVGHSHVPLAMTLVEDRLLGDHAPGGTEADLRQGRCLLNPGSVGQPRDGDPRAAWLLLDLEEGRALFRRVVYDIPATQAEIRDAGLPEFLAQRLASGV